MRERVVALVGSSGSGKTTLAEALIRRLARRGLRVAYVKHDAHRFEMDLRGKDTWRAAKAGAAAVAIASADAWAWLERTDAPPSGDRLVRMALRSADACIVEGYHGSRFPEVLVVREGIAPRRLRATRTLVATYGDPVPPGLPGARGVPHFGWRRVGPLAARLFGRSS